MRVGRGTINVHVKVNVDYCSSARNLPNKENENENDILHL